MTMVQPQKADPASLPSASPPARARKWFLGVLAAAVTAVVVQMLTGAFTSAGRWLWGLVTDPQPVQIAQYTKTPLPVQNYVIPRSPDRIPDPPTQGFEEQARWASELGGVDADSTTVRITVTGSSEEPVILHDLRINVIRRRPPIAGTHVSLGGGDITPVRWLAFDLDAEPPTLTDSVDGRTILHEIDPQKYERRPADPVTFPYEVSATDSEVFYIVAQTDGCDCEWEAELFWTTGEEEGSTLITNGGEPFRTSSIRNATATCYGGDFGPELMC